MLCKKETEAELQPPSEKHYRAIFFPADEQSPRFVWIHCKEGMLSGVDQPHTLSFLDCEYYETDTIYVEYNSMRLQDLENTVQIRVRDNFHTDGSVINQSIVQATKGATNYIWKGPILALRTRGSGMDHVHFDHMRMEDLRHVIDLFLTYHKPTFSVSDPRRARKVRGVRISCKGDQVVAGAEKYVSVQVPQDHPVFTTRIASCSISKLIGLPMFVKKYPANKAWAQNDSLSSHYENDAASYLQIQTDPSSDLWECVSSKWLDKVGSVLVVRRDRKDLSPQQCEALSQFCQSKLGPLFKSSRGGDQGTEATITNKEEVLQQITKGHFESYFAEYRASKIATDLEWEGAKSPYLT